MFNKESEKSVQRTGAETIIGQSIKVRGDFHGEGDIIIEGSVEGDISTKQSINIGANANIIANIKAKSARIAGQVRGDIRVEGYLEILGSAKIEGNIQTQEISIAKGATIEGKVTMRLTGDSVVNTQ